MCAPRLPPALWVAALALVPGVEARATNGTNLDPRLAEIAQAVKQGESLEALVAFESLPEELRTTPEARFLFAEALFLEKRWARAAVGYEDVLITGPILSDRVRFRLGSAFLQEGRITDAAAVLGDIPERSRYYGRARLLRAQAFVDLGAPEKAIDILSGWRPDEDLRPDALYMLGQAHDALGGTDSALRTYREIVLDHPGHPLAAGAAGRITVLLVTDRPAEGAAWSHLARVIGRDDARKRLSYRSRQHELAVLTGWVDYLRGRLYLDAGEPVAAVPLLARSVDSVERAGGQKDLLLRARFGLAEATRDQGRLTQAIDAYRAAAATDPAHPLAARAWLAAARLGLTLGAHHGVTNDLQSLLLHHPVHSERAHIFFQLGWAHLRQHTYPRAAEFFSAAAATDATGAALEHSAGAARIVAPARAHYWAGRALELAGRTDDAAEAYHEVLARYPLSYYAFLVEERTGGRYVTPRVVAPGREIDPRVARAIEASRLGWSRYALDELRVILEAPAAASGRDLLGAAAVLERLGRRAGARGVYRLAVMHHFAELTGAQRGRALRSSFPKRFALPLEREARRQGHPRKLVYGLVLRESDFRACAGSRVGATGLMQLMMPTARDAAADLGLRSPTRALLCDPAYNLRLGSWHLKKLMRQFDGVETLALAAYNAGAGNVQRWMNRWGLLPLDMFVEEIPYDETRVYVRIVLSAARAYAYTWEGVAQDGASPGAPGTQAR